MVKKEQKEKMDQIIRASGFRTYTELIQYWIDTNTHDDTGQTINPFSIGVPNFYIIKNEKKLGT